MQIAGRVEVLTAASSCIEEGVGREGEIYGGSGTHISIYWIGDEWYQQTERERERE